MQVPRQKKSYRQTYCITHNKLLLNCSWFLSKQTQNISRKWVPWSIFPRSGDPTQSAHQCRCEFEVSGGSSRLINTKQFSWGALQTDAGYTTFHTLYSGVSPSYLLRFASTPVCADNLIKLKGSFFPCGEAGNFSAFPLLRCQGNRTDTRAQILCLLALRSSYFLRHSPAGGILSCALEKWGKGRILQNQKYHLYRLNYLKFHRRWKQQLLQRPRRRVFFTPRPIVRVMDKFLQPSAIWRLSVC